jgi:isopentenyl diphosphate isomerase/L-lactate dehydrogenase-like FMN-dependent dehydrogenase
MSADPSPPLLSLADYERAATERLDPGAASYIFGGAGDEITLADNVAAWSRLALRPRMLSGAGTVDRGVRLLGIKRPHPLLIAPTAFQRITHPEGEIATARAAAATDTIMCLSTLGTTDPAALAHEVPDAPRWFQLYVFVDRGISRELVASAAEHGYEALVVTVDRPVLGRRPRELTSRVRSAAVHGLADATGGAAGPAGAVTPEDLSVLVDPSLTWSDIERFVAESPLPVLLKGILTAEDARLAVAHGVAGVIVSNHGGRQLDTVLSGADALPAIVDEVGDDLDVLVDGGIRRGTDVVKALALGARAVLIGRPVLWGLGLDGAEGAQRVIELLLAELDNALALVGAPRAADLDQAMVTRAPWG